MTAALKVSGGQRGSDAHDFESFDVSSVYAAGWKPPSRSRSYIAAIHGIEESGDTPALVLELVDGPTLADRIAEGPIPPQIDDIRRVWWLSPCRRSNPDY